MKQTVELSEKLHDALLEEFQKEKNSGRLVAPVSTFEEWLGYLLHADYLRRNESIPKLQK